MTWFRMLCLVICVSALPACSPRYLIVQGVGDALASQGQSAEEDLGLAREASAFYLKLSESVLQESPGNLKLAEAVAGGFTQYAFAFVAFEAQRVESKDAKAAHRLNERAKRLYLRAHRHAMAALEHATPGFTKALEQPDASRRPVVAPAQVGVAYWAAASWGAAIALSKDSPEAVADLPLAYRLAQLTYQANPHFGEGALSSLMGSFEASRPGGSLVLATVYFDAAIAAGAGKSAGAYVAKAEAIALAQGDRKAFEALLQQALDASAARRDLANEAMRERSLWLMETADDLF